MMSVRGRCRCPVLTESDTPFCLWCHPGDESSTSVVEILRRQPFQAEYVPSASPLLLQICKEGLFRGASAIASMVKGDVPSNIARTIVPTEKGLEQVREVLQMAAQGELEHIPPSIVTTAELFEAIRWPKDAESGLRFGLPGLSLFDAVKVTEEVRNRTARPPTTLWQLSEWRGLATVVQSAPRDAAVQRGTPSEECPAGQQLCGGQGCAVGSSAGNWGNLGERPLAQEALPRDPSQSSPWHCSSLLRPKTRLTATPCSIHHFCCSRPQRSRQALSLRRGICSENWIRDR